jgi:NADP-dependent 3-hydroxy acid dehydrogenase YdfG
MNGLEAKVAVIPGGTSGIAKGFPEEGARVVFVGRRRPLIWIAGQRR